MSVRNLRISIGVPVFLEQSSTVTCIAEDNSIKLLCFGGSFWFSSVSFFVLIRPYKFRVKSKNILLFKRVKDEGNSLSVPLWRTREGTGEDFNLLSWLIYSESMKTLMTKEDAHSGSPVSTGDDQVPDVRSVTDRDWDVSFRTSNTIYNLRSPFHIIYPTNNFLYLGVIG